MHTTILTIGKEAAHIILPYEGISAKHAQLVINHTNGEIEFVDHSEEGTIVGNEIIHHRSKVIRRGDPVIFNSKPPIRLDWAKVPVLPNFSIYKKTIAIGRNAENDIVLDSKFSKTGRTHALLLMDKRCRFFLYDTSLNGSRINGIPVQRYQLTAVRYKRDKINFSGQCDLDWSKIPTPPVFCYYPASAYLLALGLLIAILLWWLPPRNQCENANSYKALIVQTYIYRITDSYGNIFYLGKDGRLSLKAETATPFVGVGTGFSPMKGYLATNFHVTNVGTNYIEQIKQDFQSIDAVKVEAYNVQLYAIQDGQQIDRTMLGGSSTQLPAGTFIKVSLDKFDPEHDLAILKIENPKDHAQFPSIDARCFACSEEDLKAVQEQELGVKYCGFPQAIVDDSEHMKVRAVCYDGKINRLEEDEQDFLIDATAAGGASGSAVFSSDNKLIGVIYAGNFRGGDVTNLILAIKGKYLIDLLKLYPEFESTD